MKRFWTADLHLGHGNVIKYCGRPYNSTHGMNKSILHNINERMTEEDVMIHVGDFMVRGGSSKFRHWQGQVPGSWVFIRGNHDKNNGCKPTCDYMVVTIGGMRAFVSHFPWWYHTMETFISLDGEEYPTKAWQWPEVPGIMATCQFAICGHVHEKWKVMDWDGVPTINVGVDVHNMMPFTDNEILRVLVRYKKEKKNAASE